MPNPIVAVAGLKAGGSVLTGSKSARAAKRAADAQVAAQERAAALQKEMFDKQVELNEPFRQAGVTTTNELLRQMGLTGDAASQGYGNLLRDFGAQDFQADPGYAFRMSEGLKGLDRQAAARGGLISGAALKAAQGYGQNLASQEYQNAYNRYNENRNARYNMLTGQQNLGAAAAGRVGSAGQNYANQAGQNYVGAGNARATGYENIAAAKNAMIGNLTNIGAQLAGGLGGSPGSFIDYTGSGRGPGPYAPPVGTPGINY